MEPDAKLPKKQSTAVRQPFSEMSEREFLAQFAMRPSLFLGRATWDRVVAWLEGYDAHGTRSTGGALDGFRGWLLDRPGARGKNLVWSAIVWLFAFPDGEPTVGADLTDDEERHALKVLFRLVDEFLADDESRTPSGHGHRPPALR